MHRFFVVFFTLTLSYLLSGCAAPAAMIWMMQDVKSDSNLAAEAKAEEFEIEEDNLYTIVMNIETTEGDESFYVYAGEYNMVRITLPEGVDAKDLELTTTAGTIDITKEDSTLYRLFVKEPYLTLEITATDKKTGALGFLITETIEHSLPSIGFNDFDTGEISVEDIKKQGQLVISYDEENFSICLCKGFKLTRVPVAGNKVSVINKSEIFESEVKSLLSKAAKGDIYIFEDIIVSCNGNLGDNKVSTLVYIVK